MATSQKRSVSSRPAEASRLPSGANSNAVTGSVCPWSVCSRLPVFRSWMAIEPSAPARATQLSPAAMQLAGSRCSARRQGSDLPSGCQTIAPRCPVNARRRPSRLQAKACNSPSFASSLPKGRPPPPSQSLTQPSFPVEAKREPSGL